MKIYKCKSLHGPLLIVVLSIDAGRESVRILLTLMCSLTVQILEIVPWMITGRLKYVPFPPHSLILRVLQIWISYLLHLRTSFFSLIHSMDVFCAFCIKEAKAEKLNDKNPFSPEFIFELNEARTHKNPNSLQSVHRFNQKISCWLNSTWGLGHHCKFDGVIYLRWNRLEDNRAHCTVQLVWVYVRCTFWSTWKEYSQSETQNHRQFISLTHS